MFKQTMEQFGQYVIIKVLNQDTGEYFSVIPELGGRVYDLCLRNKEELCVVLDNEKDPEAMKDERWYKGVILVPFPNRIRNGVYEFNGKQHQLPINFPNEGHAIHGFTYNKKFSVIESDCEKTGSLVVSYDYDGSYPGYPFPCLITYTFSLEEGNFSCKVGVINKGKEKLPLGVGWHPYFTLGSDADELLLQMPEVHSVIVDNTMIPTGEKEVMDDYKESSQIHDTNFDTGFILGKPNGVVATSLYNPHNNLTVSVWQSAEEGFNYVQVFTPPGRKTVAIEPMTCPANAFNSQEGLIELSENQEWKGSFGVRVESQ